MAVNVADRAVATAALARVLEELGGTESAAILERGYPQDVVDHLLDKAAKIRFQPSTRQLVLTFDLAFGTQDDASGPVA